MAKQPKKLGLIQCPPPSNHHQMMPSELLKALMIAGDWDGNALTEAISNSTSKGISLDGIKRWMHNNTIPKGENREALNRAIFNYCKDSDSVDPEVWQNALYQSWIRYNSSVKNVAKTICERITRDSRFTHLPPLYVTDTPKSIESDYLTLYLEKHVTFSTKKPLQYSPASLLDKNEKLSTLIIADPGCGKSSLLRKVALDIAQDQWKSVKVPLMITAKEYIQAHNKQPNIDLISFAFKDFFIPEQPHTHFNLNIRNSLLQEKIILLIDGIDEVSLDKQAVINLYTELRSLRGTVSWIVTARPSGLMDTLNESRRFWVAPLNKLAIEEYIDKIIDNYSLDAHFKYQAFGNPSLLRLISNPFFLTLFCHAQVKIAQGLLDQTPIAIQEFFLDSIKIQAQKNTPLNNPLSIVTLDKLQQFSLIITHQSQHKSPSFNEQHWWNFSAKKYQQHSSLDFFEQVLPARLITTSDIAMCNYRFINPTLQQQLNAHALLKLPAEFALEKRFAKKWHDSFAVYAALSYHYKDYARFDEIISCLESQSEINQSSEQLISKIFFLAGIPKTQNSQLIKARDSLSLSHQVIELESNQRLKFLAKLDPSWLEQTLLAQLPNADADYRCEQISYQETVRLLNSSDNRVHSFKALGLLNSSASYEAISQAFWSTDRQNAICAAQVFGEVILPSDYQQVVLLSQNKTLSDLEVIKLLLFIRTRTNKDFIPFLIPLAQRTAYSSFPLFNEACKLIIKLDAELATKAFAQILSSQYSSLLSNSHSFAAVAEKVEQLPGANITRIFDEQTRSLYLPKYAKKIENLILTCSHSSCLNDNIVINCHEDFATAITIIKHTDYDPKLLTSTMLNTLNQYIKKNITKNVFEFIAPLVNIEFKYMSHNNSPVLSPTLLQLTDYLCKYLNQWPNQNQRTHYIQHLESLFEVLSITPQRGVEVLVLKLLFHSQDEALLRLAIRFTGKLFVNQFNDMVLTKLKTILYYGNRSLRKEVTLAMGRIDLEALNYFQSAEQAKQILARIAEEKKSLIFQDFWSDSEGKKIYWKYPPIPVYYIYNSYQKPEIERLFAHEMSQYGYCVSHQIQHSKIYLVFSTDSVYEQKQVEEAQLISNSRGLSGNIFHIPDGIPFPLAKTLARLIAQSLASRAITTTNNTFNTLSLP